jgi:hypothetical protein
VPTDTPTLTPAPTVEPDTNTPVPVESPPAT